MAVYQDVHVIRTWCAITLVPPSKLMIRVRSSSAALTKAQLNRN